MVCFLSSLAHPFFREYMEKQGFQLMLLYPRKNFEWETSAHPDSLLFRLGDRLFSFPEETDGRHYPGSAALCGLLAGRYFIHNLSITPPFLLEEIKKAGYIPVDVPQGYCRCSILKVDENSLITADWGIARVLKEKTDLNLLLCEPGQILLDRHTGFWGGCAGCIKDEVVFHGSLRGQPGEEKIRAFIRKRGLKLREFDFPLRDIGGWVFSTKSYPDIWPG